MVKVTVRKASAVVLTAALAHSTIACAPARHSTESDGFETDVASQAEAYSVPTPGEATLGLDYLYVPSGAPVHQLVVSGGTSDELLRVGEKLTATLPGWAILPLVQDDAGSVTTDNLQKSAVTLAVTWLEGGRTLSNVTVKTASWNLAGTYGWPDAVLEPFVVPSGATGFRATIVATSPDGKKTGRDVLAEGMVFGGELPNKHMFFDIDSTANAPRSRVIERGGPVKGSELVVAYADTRADRLVDVGSIDRRVGRVKTYNPRFGTYEGDVFGELVHIVSVGYDFGGGFSEQAMVQSPISYVRGGKSQETRLAVPASATKAALYFHVKTYLVAKYPSYGEITERKYAEGEWVLVREKWDNPSGAGTNFDVGTEAAEPLDPGIERTVVFVKGETSPGQDMFLRGGIDHEVSKKLRGVDCQNADGTPNYLCAIPIVHRNLRNATTRSWKLGDAYLDWYGQEKSQLVASVTGLAQGTAADWTTNAWPASWGPVKTVAVDGYGVEKLNDVGPHLWMLDVDMDCGKAFEAADGTRWFEVKSFISNGPGWEGDVAQAGAPYASPNHLAKCGQVSFFERGSGKATFVRFPK